jgi:hypothetical protein
MLLQDLEGRSDLWIEQGQLLEILAGGLEVFSTKNLSLAIQYEKGSAQSRVESAVIASGAVVT